MRLGWTTGKYSTTYRAIKTVRINGKNKTQIVRSFGSEKHICKTYGVTDAGLSSATNRVFNTYDEADGLRGYITTQPIKTLKDFLQQWCMAEDGWILDGDTSGKKYALSELDDEQDKDKIFYKTRWIKEEGTVHTEKGDRKQLIEQKLIVSYSMKYRNYMRRIRERQIERTQKLVESGEKTINRKKQNDPRRFIKTNHATKEGEVAEQAVSYIDQSIIDEEAKYLLEFEKSMLRKYNM